MEKPGPYLNALSPKDWERAYRQIDGTGPKTVIFKMFAYSVGGFERDLSIIAMDTIKNVLDKVLRPGDRILFLTSSDAEEYTDLALAFGFERVGPSIESMFGWENMVIKKRVPFGGTLHISYMSTNAGFAVPDAFVLLEKKPQFSPAELQATSDQQTESAKDVIADLRNDTTDILLFPSMKKGDSQHAAVASKIAHKDFGPDTKVYHYAYEGNRYSSIHEELGQSMKELMYRLRSGDKRARCLAILNAGDVKLFASMTNKIAKKLAEDAIEFEDLVNRVTVLPVDNIPANGILDDVYYVVAAKGILNAKRYEAGDYGDGTKMPEDAQDRLVGFLSTLFDDVKKLGSTPIEILNAILSGTILRIKPIDFQNIQEYRDRQKDLLTAL